MQYTILSLAVAATLVAGQTTTSTVVSTSSSSSSSSSAASTSTQGPIGAIIPVGKECKTGGTPCALGAQCYASNSMLQLVCGNFNAACTSNQQCAFNTCENGLCSGFLSTSSSSASTTSSVTSSHSDTASHSSTTSNGTVVAPVSTTTAPVSSMTTVVKPTDGGKPVTTVVAVNGDSAKTETAKGETGAAATKTGSSEAAPTSPEAQLTNAASLAGVSSTAMMLIVGVLAFVF